ncbi:MAG: tol-pal system YbgF family protein [Bacteroidales bacterium]
MSNQIDYSGFVERYLSKKMEQDELTWFKEEMEVNPSLADEVQMQKDIGKAILNEETLDFRAQINSLFEKEENEVHITKAKARKTFTIPHMVRVAVASLAAFVLLGSGIYLFTFRTIPADKLFEMYYQPYDGLMNVRSGNTQINDVLVKAMQKYEDKEFESALLLFETVLANDSENITSRFYSGISYLETERFTVAEKSFEGVIDHDDNLFIEQAEWYLGLCYLKTGEQEMAKSMFAVIAKNDGFYSKSANRILRNL